MYDIQIDGFQFENIKLILNKNKLVPPLYFKKTSSGITIESDLPIYPPIPQDWYWGSPKISYAQQNHWKFINVVQKGEEVKSIKVGMQFLNYKNLIVEYYDVFA